MSREKVKEQFLQYAYECVTVTIDDNVPFSVFLPALSYEIHRYLSIPYQEAFNRIEVLYRDLCQQSNDFKRNVNKLVREIVKQYHTSDYKQIENSLRGHLFNIFSFITQGSYTLYFCPLEAFLDIKIQFGEKYDIDSCFRPSGCNHHHFIILKDRLHRAKASYIGIVADNNVGRFWAIRAEDNSYLVFNVYGDYQSVWNVILPFTIAVQQIENRPYVFVVLSTNLTVYTNNSKVGIIYSDISTSPYDVLDKVVEEVIAISCDYCGHSYAFVEPFHSVYYKGNILIVCDECNSEEFVRCEVCGEIYHYDEIIWLDDRAYCKTCAEDRIVYCAVCDESISVNDAYYDHYGNCYCESCLYENTFTCEKCDETFPIRDIIRIYYSDNTSEHLCPYCASHRLDTTLTEIRNLIREEIHDLFECVGCAQFVPEHQIENELCPQCREEVKEVVNE